MVQQIVNIGSAANDGTGDPLRTAFTKVNQNFTELYGRGAAGANFDFTDNTLASTNTNGNIELSPNGTGRIVLDYGAWPLNDGSSNQILMTNGSGNLFWGAGAVGNNTEVAFIDGSSLKGDFKLTFDKTNGVLSVSAISVGGDSFFSGNIIAPAIRTINTNQDITIDPNGTGQVVVYANIIPGANVTYSLGAPNAEWDSLYVSGNTIYVGGTPLSVSGDVFTPGKVEATDITAATSATTGALKSAGGLGVAGNIYAGGNIVTSGKFQGDGGLLTNIAVSAGTSIVNGTSNVRVGLNTDVIISSAGANVVTITGTGANVAGTANITGNANVGNLGTVGNVTAGYFIGNGSQLTGVTTATSATTAGTVTTAAQPNITSVGTLSSLAVTGNVSAANLVATGDLYLNGNDIRSSTGNVAISLNNTDVTIAGNLVVQGTRTEVGTSDLIVSDSLINLHTQPNLAPLTVDDGRDIGLVFHYYKTSDKQAFLGWANDSSTLEYYSEGIESNTGVFSGTYGTMKLANVFVTDGVVYNGNSNVTIAANSDVSVSVAGNANVLTITGTGANISGTANITGNANVGNIGAGTVVATNLTGNLTTAAQPNITSVGTLTSVTVAAGTNSVAPVNLTSGTNLTSAIAGAFEYDGTILNFTPNTNFGRAAIPTTVYTSGAGANLSPTGTGENSAQSLFPAGNDTITLPIGTYYIKLIVSITRGNTSTTSAAARINLGGGGSAAGTFSGTAISNTSTSIAAANLVVFNGVALTVDNVVSAALSALGTYNVQISGILRITTAGTITPKYSLTNALTGATTATSTSAVNSLVIQSIATSGSAAATGGWA